MEQKRESDEAHEKRVTCHADRHDGREMGTRSRVLRPEIAACCCMVSSSHCSREVSRDNGFTFPQTLGTQFVGMRCTKSRNSTADEKREKD